ncbi:hypothetical protein DFP72DRAFT_847588 [Ephemerocybe angulata]|uniref:Uncharacterized protein n=1 Tax=Ephemerocybe angulata TaxID=980116 RepID=A0A8H6HZR2_9AGAR|nr:hypothetical protein DFP72DRAFT_847588 [Tulosesus angulatus]
MRRKRGYALGQYTCINLTGRAGECTGVTQWNRGTSERDSTQTISPCYPFLSEDWGGCFSGGGKHREKARKRIETSERYSRCSAAGVSRSLHTTSLTARARHPALLVVFAVLDDDELSAAWGPDTTFELKAWSRQPPRPPPSVPVSFNDPVRHGLRRYGFTLSKEYKAPSRAHKKENPFHSELPLPKTEAGPCTISTVPPTHVLAYPDAAPRLTCRRLIAMPDFRRRCKAAVMSSECRGSSAQAGSENHVTQIPPSRSSQRARHSARCVNTRRWTLHPDRAPPGQIVGVDSWLLECRVNGGHRVRPCASTTGLFHLPAPFKTTTCARIFRSQVHARAFVLGGDALPSLCRTLPRAGTWKSSARSRGSFLDAESRQLERSPSLGVARAAEGVGQIFEAVGGSYELSDDTSTHPKTLYVKGADNGKLAPKLEGIKSAERRYSGHRNAREVASWVGIACKSPFSWVIEDTSGDNRM